MQKLLFLFIVCIVATACTKSGSTHAINGRYTGIRHKVEDDVYTDSVGVVHQVNIDTTYTDTVGIYSLPGDTSFTVEGSTFSYNASNLYVLGTDPNHYIYSVTFTPSSDSLIIYDHVYGGFSTAHNSHTFEFRERETNSRNIAARTGRKMDYHRHCNKCPWRSLGNVKRDSVSFH